MTKTRHLTRLDSKPLSSQGDIPVFMVARNEMLRLPSFFQHYRKLGVRRFYVVDDHSADGSRDWLLSQPDCALFSPDNGYAQSFFGLNWQKELMDAFNPGGWCLVVDADELFVYPHAEKLDLRGLCDHLDTLGKTAMPGFMLDMYPKGDLADAVLGQGQSLTDICPYFDTAYSFPNRFVHYMPFRRKALPTYEVLGGPRARLFYADQVQDGILRRIVNRLVWRLAAFIAAFELWPAESLPHPAPALHKVPLIKWNGKTTYTTAHTVRDANLSDETCVLLHFKFLADFQAKALTEAQREQHFKGGLEYKRYLRALAQNPHMVFFTEKSRRYTCSDDVLEAGLMRSSPALDAKAR